MWSEKIFPKPREDSSPGFFLLCSGVANVTAMSIPGPSAFGKRGNIMPGYDLYLNPRQWGRAGTVAARTAGPVPLPLCGPRGKVYGRADTGPHQLLPAGGEGPVRRGPQAGGVPGGDAGQ